MSRDNFGYNALYSVSVQALREERCGEEAKFIVDKLLKFEEKNYTKIKRGTEPCCGSRCRFHRRFLL